MTLQGAGGREPGGAQDEAPSAAGAYDRFAYPGYAYPATHPARLEVIGRLFGLDPRPAAGARVLELGCGDGGNLLSLAAALPGASLLGIDAAAGAVARGNELARASGLDNVRMLCADLEALPGDLGSFDYILSHGVYSWIPPLVRLALLAGIRRHMAPAGIAYVSYNAYPGSYLRDMARDILGYHVREISDPQARLAAAQELMQTIVKIDDPSPYAQVLRVHMERMLRYSDALLFHDDLAEISTPFYLHEFVAHANHHQLAFLAEADLSESQMRDVPESAGRLMSQLPDDVVVREQYLDFFKNRMFRQTLLCHADAPVIRELDDSQLEGCMVCAQVRPEEPDAQGGEDAVKDSSARAQRTPPPAAVSERSEDDEEGNLNETFITPEGFTVTTSEPLVRSAMHALADAWPASLHFSTLLAAALRASGPDAQEQAVRMRLRVVLLQAHLARIVRLESCAPALSTQPGERPLASSLARAQCAAGLLTVSSLTHANVRLENDLEPRLLALLDGTREPGELAEALASPAADVQATLRRFASVGLLRG